MQTAPSWCRDGPNYILLPGRPGLGHHL